MTDPRPAPDIVRAAARLLTQVNLARAAAAVAPVTEAHPLRRAAHLHAADMAGRDRLDHAGADGSWAVDRFKRQGYEPGAVGEVVGQGFPDPESAVAGWLASRGHRAIVLDPKFIHMGGAVGRSARGTLYWVADFGSPPITILQGADRE